MAKRCCRGCVYGLRPTSHWLRIILARWPGLLICFNCAQNPGTIQEVYAHGTCRNFQGRREPSGRREPRQPENADFRYIGLTKGKVAIVDAADYEWLSQYKWSAVEKGGTFYACRREGRRTIWMHREIMKPPKGKVVDHIDGNGLHNRRGNMRNCTPQQNAYNIKHLCEGSRYAGVFPCGTLWGAKIIHEGQEYWLGLFDTELEAALARDRKALELLGKYAYLNFPHEFETRLKANYPPAHDPKSHQGGTPDTHRPLPASPARAARRTPGPRCTAATTAR